MVYPWASQQEYYEQHPADGILDCISKTAVRIESSIPHTVAYCVLKLNSLASAKRDQAVLYRCNKPVRKPKLFFCIMNLNTVLQIYLPHIK